MTEEEEKTLDIVTFVGWMDDIAISKEIDREDIIIYLMYKKEISLQRISGDIHWFRSYFEHTFGDIQKSAAFERAEKKANKKFHKRELEFFEKLSMALTAIRELRDEVDELKKKNLIDEQIQP